MEVSLTVMHKWDLGEELLQESQQEAMVAWLGKESLAESQGGEIPGLGHWLSREVSGRNEGL